MSFRSTRWIITAAICLAGAAQSPREKPLAAIQVDYPLSESIFPPDMAAPTFIWSHSAMAQEGCKRNRRDRESTSAR